MKKGNVIFGVILVVTTILIFVMLGLVYLEIKKSGGQVEEKEKERGEETYVAVSEDGTFGSDFIKMSHSYLKDANYMVSPYSVEIALSMLREGAKGDSYQELNEIVPERSIKSLKVKKRVNVANAIFIKEKFKEDMLPSYMDTLNKKYGADVVYDPFTSPKKINDWVSHETNGMIPEILKAMDPDFVLGIANAVAMEEKWKVEFECEKTRENPFTKLDGTEMNASMMYQTYENTVSYYKDDSLESVIIPYTTYNRLTGKKAKKGEQLDFVGILPNDLDSYVSNFSLEDMKKIVDNSQMADEDLKVTVGLPRFEFEFDYGEAFKEALIHMGIQSIFVPGKCDLSNMIENHGDIYVDEAIHKSYVKVNEAGTKAAAVTYFGTKDNAVAEADFKMILFDKPFVFIIKDHVSNEILFFGVVYEPEEWSGENVCE